jgi:hypothetical protein
MTATATGPITCTPWCAYSRDGDGHADAVFAEDQSCMGESHIVSLSLADNDRDKLDVLAWRDNGKRPDVCLNVSLGHVDVDVHLAPAEARHLAETLLSVADIVEATG